MKLRILRSYTGDRGEGGFKEELWLELENKTEFKHFRESYKSVKGNK